MSIVQLKATACAGVYADNITGHYTPPAYLTAKYPNGDNYILFQFEQVPAQYRYNYYSVNGVYVYFRQNEPHYGSVDLFKVGQCSTLYAPFDPATVTYETMPRHDNYGVYNKFSIFYYENPQSWQQPASPPTLQGLIRNAIDNGLLVTQISTFGNDMATANAPQNLVPYIEIDFGSVKANIKPTGSPSSGYRNPHADIELKWSNGLVGTSIYKPEQTSAVVYWRESGSSTEHTITVTTETSVTIPADTWSSGTSYQWKVAVTDSGGTTTETAWYTISTTASSAKAPALVYPDWDVVDGARPITFRWTRQSIGNNTGTEIAFSLDGTTWDEPIFFEPPESGMLQQTYTAPAGTFTSGTHYWRGRTLNADGVAGNWSTAAEFTVIASPRTPYIEVTSVSPRPVVTWESDEQQAYQVQMGSYDSGLRYGLDHTFQCPEFLPDGQTTIRVRVMNQYNLWSDWANTSINIENKPGFSTPTLTVEQSQDALLSWTEVVTEKTLSGLDFTIGKHLYTDGRVVNGATRAATVSAVGISGAARIRYTGPAQSAGGTAYEVYVGFYRTETGDFISPRVALTGGAWKTVPDGAAYARFGIGFPASTGVAPTQTDCDNCVIEMDSELGEVAGYLVYRNGTQIAETDGLTYTDRWANGPTIYMVRAILGGNNYVDSNTVEINLETEHPMIAEPGGPWMELRYSTDAVHNTQTTVQQTVTLMQFSGSVYPEAEAAPYRQRSRQISVAFLNGQELAFEALLGRECVLRDQYGGVIYGIMSSMSKAQNQFYCVISATIQQLEGEP